MLQYFMLRNGVSTCIWKICPLRMMEDYIGYAFQILIVTMVSSTYMTVAEKYIFQRLLKGQLQRSCAPPYLRSLWDIWNAQNQSFSWTEIYFGHFVQAVQILFGHLEFFRTIFQTLITKHYDWFALVNKYFRGKIMQASLALTEVWPISDRIIRQKYYCITVHNRIVCTSKNHLRQSV